MEPVSDALKYVVQARNMLENRCGKEKLEDTIKLLEKAEEVLVNNSREQK